MPNWCSQDLIITGPTVELMDFKKFAKSKESVLDTEAFIPYPEKFKEHDKKVKKQMEEYNKLSEEERKNKEYPKDSFNLDDSKDKDLLVDGMSGYWWCINNWGSKWGICQSELTSEKLDNETGKLVYCFDSAWSPVIPVIAEMSRLFNNLRFELKYFEAGMEFQGKYVYEKGEVINSEHRDYSGDRGG